MVPILFDSVVSFFDLVARVVLFCLVSFVLHGLTWLPWFTWFTLCITPRCHQESFSSTVLCNMFAPQEVKASTARPFETSGSMGSCTIPSAASWCSTAGVYDAVNPTVGWGYLDGTLRLASWELLAGVRARGCLHKLGYLHWSLDDHSCNSGGMLYLWTILICFIISHGFIMSKCLSISQA